MAADDASAVRAALALACAACGADFAAIATADGLLRFTVLEASRAGCPAGLRLSLPESASDGWCAVGAQRLSSAWMLATGLRPAWIGAFPVEDTGWTLLLARAEPAPPQVRTPEAACTVLAALQRSGRQTRAERGDEDRMRALVSQLDTPVLFVDAHAPRTYLNPAAASLLRLPEVDPSPASVAAALRGLLADAGLLDQSHAPPRLPEVLHFLFDVDDRHWAVNSRRIDTDALAGRLWLFTDLTEGRTRERMLLEGQRDETVGRISAGIAHHFNNLLTVILGNAERVEMAPGLAPPLRSAVADLIAAGEQCAEIVSHLLAFASRRRAGGGGFDPGEELGALLPLLRGVLPDGVRLEASHLLQGRTVEGDRERFCDAVMHLVLNARDAMPAGGVLRLSLQEVLLPLDEHSEPGVLGRSASASAPMRWVRLQVQDSGHGMDAGVRARAFDPFFTTRGMASARGLGLSVVQGFVQASGGRIHLHSVPGQGTCAEMFLLPMTQ